MTVVDGEPALADEFVQRWADALEIDVDRVRRVVVDATAGEPLSVFVEQYGTDALVTVAPPGPAEVDVRVAGREPARHRYVDRLSELVAQLADDEPCRLDHEGGCQTHAWFGGGLCPHAQARRLLDRGEDR